MNRGIAHSIIYNKREQVRPAVATTMFLASGFFLAHGAFGQKVVYDKVGKMKDKEKIEIGNTIMYRNGKVWGATKVGTIKNVGDEFEPKTLILGDGGNIPPQPDTLFNFQKGERIVITLNTGDPIEGAFVGIRLVPGQNVLYVDCDGEVRKAVPINGNFKSVARKQ